MKRMAKKAAAKMSKAKTVKGAARIASRFEARAYTREQAMKASAGIISKRLKAVTFLKFFFTSMAKGFASITGKGSPSGKRFSGFEVSISPATENRPVSSAVVAYNYKNRSDKTAKATEQLLQSTLNQAISATVIDMEQYIQDEMRGIDRQHSATGAI